MTKIILQGSICALAEMTEDYLPQHVNFLRNPQVIRYVRIRLPITLESQRTWLEQMRTSRADLVFAVLVQPESKFVGVVGLHEIDHFDRTARGGAIIGDRQYWGRGIATEARFLQLKFAFEVLRLRWVWGSTIRPNKRSQRLLARTGYVQVGIRPRCRRVGNVFEDELLYAVSPAQWRKAYREYLHS